MTSRMTPMHEPAKSAAERICHDEVRKQASIVVQFQSICNAGSVRASEEGGARRRRTEIWQAPDSDEPMSMSIDDSEDSVLWSTPLW